MSADRQPIGAGTYALYVCAASAVLGALVVAGTLVLDSETRRDILTSWYLVLVPAVAYAVVRSRYRLGDSEPPDEE